MSFFDFKYIFTWLNSKHYSIYIYIGSKISEQFTYPYILVLRLPFLVNQTFGVKLVDSVTLKDIQDEIFEKIPFLLEETIDIQTNIIDNEIKSTTKLKEEILNPSKLNGEVELNVKEETIAELEENFGENLEDISNIISMEDSFDEDYKPPSIRLIRKARKSCKNDAILERYYCSIFSTYFSCVTLYTVMKF